MKWLVDNGVEVETVPRDTPVTLQAVTRGYANGWHEVTIWESDPFQIEYIDTVSMNFVDGVGTAEWTTFYAGGGLFEGGVEYFFLVQSFSIRSPQLYVP